MAGVGLYSLIKSNGGSRSSSVSDELWTKKKYKLYNNAAFCFFYLVSILTPLSLKKY